MDQPGKVANPARGQLNRENNIPLSPCVPENLVSRDGFSRPVPRQPAHLHTQAESGAYLRDSSRVPRRRPFMKPPYAIGSVPSLSGHAIAYRWRSLPRVRRHRASEPQGSSEQVLPWQITMDQLIFASLSHTHYWYEVGMLKVPAVERNGCSGGVDAIRILHTFNRICSCEVAMSAGRFKHSTACTDSYNIRLGINRFSVRVLLKKSEIRGKVLLYI